VDFEQLDEMYARKGPPDSTMIRMEKLEQQVAHMNSRYVHNVGDVGNAIQDEISKTIPREIS
jgi:hypothetical protein